MRRWAGFAFFAFALNFMWEMGQGFLFANMKLIPTAAGTRWCFLAALADVVIFGIAYVVAAIASRQIMWTVSQPLAIAVFFTTALAITIGYERFAVRTGRWQYDERMPVILGIGVAPLLQWIIVPTIVLAINARSRPISNRKRPKA